MKIIIALALIALSTAAIADQVQGYVRSDGTYVQSYNRSSPNSTTSDNYSTRGNTNPYTGSQGTQNPQPSGAYQSPQPYRYTPR